MPTMPCCFKSLCIDPANPFENLSAEGPDQEVFIGFNDGPAFNPPLGHPWGSSGCITFCESTISQADADLCAARQSVLCATSGGGPGSVASGPPGWGITGKPIQLFSNNVSFCTGLCPDGLPFTYQVAAGLFVGTSQAQVDAMAFSYACLLVNTNRVCLSAMNVNGCVNSGYASVITASGRGPFQFFVVSGTFPPGLQMIQEDIFSVDIVGTPTQAGTFSFLVRAQNTLTGNFMQKVYTIHVLAITNSPTPATVGSAYSFTFTATGGTPPYTWLLASGSLPTGLTLTSDGTISGTPTSPGTFSFDVSVTDSSQ